MQSNTAVPKTNTETLDASEQQNHQRIDERTVSPHDVYRGTGKAGELTAAGLQLQQQNPQLLAMLVAHAQYELHQQYPYLYPPVPQPPAIQGIADSAPPAGAPASRPKPHRPTPLPDDQIRRLWGKGSDAGECNRLSKANAALYEASRERAVELGLVGSTRLSGNRSSAVRAVGKH